MDLGVFYRFYPSYMKRDSLSKCSVFWKVYLKAMWLRKMLQQATMPFVQKWKRSVDGGVAFGILLTDSSKAYNCLDHELIIAKTKLIWSHHQLQDALWMAYPPHHWEWIHPFQVFRHIKSSPADVLQLMVIYYVETPEMGVSILSDGVGKPFSVRPTADDDLLCRNAWNRCIHSLWWGG